MNIIFKFSMFFTSFLPLWVSIIVNNLWDIISGIYSCNERSSIIDIIKIIYYLYKIEMIVVIVIFIFLLFTAIYIYHKINTERKLNKKSKCQLQEVRKANKLSSDFLFAYILPLFSFDFGELKSIVLFMIYFLVLAFICIRNNNIYTNIFLELIGYKMYECDVKCKVLNESEKIYYNCLVISKNNLSQHVGNEIKYFDFDKYIYIDIGG